MDQFIVSARKYRPSTFESVVGQKHITTTLQNALKNHQLAQAFLFCGPRGVGKTTCARILAKTINCMAGPDRTEPCNACESCDSFNKGQSFNIIELDAASNNSVDDIRELVEQVRFAPQLGKYRVFIIDEVHMLSSSAFNAFLKTLEEPPAHAIFILATTEKHKIIPTILSRCQIFDFYRIRVQDIAEHLAYIAKQEKVEAEPDALHIIAHKADGGLRDACSMFDQIVSFSGGKVTYQSVIDNLNILDYDYYFGLINGFLKNDISAGFLTLDDILARGFDGLNFLSGLATHFRNLVVARNPATVGLIETGETIREKYQEQAKRCTAMFIFQSLKLLSEGEVQYRQSKNPRLVVELTLMKLSLLQKENRDEKKNDISEGIPPKAKQIPSEDLNIAQSTVAEPRPAAFAQKPVMAAENIQSTSPEQAKTPIQASAPTAPAGSLVSKASMPRISTLLNKVEKQDKTEAPDAHVSLLDKPGNDPFNEEMLRNKWAELAGLWKSGKGEFVYSTLVTGELTLGEDCTIHFLVNNASQTEMMNGLITEMAEWLRKSLNNQSIKLRFGLIKTEEGKEKKAYTSKEKFEKMAQLNPNIQLLKQKLDLDIL
ncbi:MAG: DNA polymerase III subunit gamma/tau [Bacteroidota bacterium]|jgi:DNA polymerase-3 subunit gamma/tau